MFNSSNHYRMREVARMPLTLDQVRERAPSAFATQPSGKVSDKYEFIPTTRVMDSLIKEGWTPVNANQSRSRSDEGQDTVRHIITFQNQSVAKIGNDTPELILTNAHNGLSAFNIMAGLYRQVCSNGLMVFSPAFGSYSIKHIGFKAEEVLEASYKIIESVPMLTESVERMREVNLNRDEQIALAQAALTIKYDESKMPITAEQLLLTRRHEDRSPDLWNTFNAIQENMVKGGLRSVSVNERTGRRHRSKTREIKSVAESVRVNKALWALAEKMRELKVG